MIPTRVKSRLAKSLSWPLGGEAISAALAGAPHFGDLVLSFRDSPVWPASEFRRLLRESTPYAILVAEYLPASKPGYGGATFLVERGCYAAKWELRVNPVLRETRAAAGRTLRESGLPAVSDWLRSSGQPGWDDRHQRLSLVWHPANGTLTSCVTDGV